MLRALTEAGIKIDIFAGRGVGAVAALFGAVDRGASLWDADGLWRDQPGLGRLYRWRWPWRMLAVLLLAALLALLTPLLAILAVAVTYPVALVLQLAAGAGGTAAARRLFEFAAVVQDPAWFGNWVPRLVTLVLVGAVASIVVLTIRQRSQGLQRRSRDSVLWRALGAPFDGAVAARWIRASFWRHLKGVVAIAEPTAADLSKRYADLLAENLGQPGYGELMIVVHDLDAQRDIVFALLAEPYRRTFFGDAASGEAGGRRAELVDLAGLGQGHVADAVGASLSVPIATEPHLMTYPLDSFWRGETHRLHDRTDALARLLQELSAAGVEQVVLVSADPALDGPHALRPVVFEPRRRFGEWLASAETAAVRDATSALFDRFSGVFHVRPVHNPLGPFDLLGAYDEHSDRPFDLTELIARGYEDAYRQFVEPIVGEAAHDEA